MSKPRSRLIDYKAREFRQVRGFTTEVHFGNHEKHYPSSREFSAARSPLAIGILEVQRLIEEKAGTGRWEGDHKEVVDFGVVIGSFRDQHSGRLTPTTRGTIHYSKKGAHIVPARPRTRARRRL